ncbi:MAG TPA: LuxR C-terminal-related transcriptional regulator, partial [Ktedonobacteraceae bacterium]|nr:LuxR C-terminal-related transcriptional regulator [Ktedonobacteraceae bacterium]
PEAARVMHQVRSIAEQLDLPIFSLLSRLLQIRIELAQGHDTAANRFLARQEWKRGPEAAHTMHQTLPITERLNLAAFSILSLWGQMGMELAHHPAEKAGDFHDPSGRYIHEQPMIQAGAVVREERHLAAHAARLALACGRVQEALHWKETCGVHADDQLGIPLESRRYFDYMTLARLLIAQGRTEHIRSPLVQALTLLEHLRDVVVRMGLHGWLIEIQMLTALALQAQGKTRRALLTLGEVLAQAEPEGYVSLFADEGLPMAYLLAQVSVSTTASSGYLELLQAATASRQLTLSDAQQSDSCQLLSPPLSAREQEVLQLIAEGASNQQIADRLVISLNTAKRHVKHLLVKLSVTNRTQAVVRARALHLL